MNHLNAKSTYVTKRGSIVNLELYSGPLGEQECWSAKNGKFYSHDGKQCGAIKGKPDDIDREVLALKVDGWYLNRRGRLINITRKAPSCPYIYYDKSSSRSGYTAKGEYLLGDFKDYRTLIEEVPAPIESTTKPMKHLNTKSTYILESGAEITLESQRASRNINVRFRGSNGAFYTEDGKTTNPNRKNQSIVREKLQLRVGGKYLRRDGKVAEIANTCASSSFPYQKRGGGYYTCNGIYYLHSVREHKHKMDLVEEVPPKRLTRPPEEGNVYALVERGIRVLCVGSVESTETITKGHVRAPVKSKMQYLVKFPTGKEQRVDQEDLMDETSLVDWSQCPEGFGVLAYVRGAWGWYKGPIINLVANPKLLTSDKETWVQALDKNTVYVKPIDLPVN